MTFNVGDFMFTIIKTLVQFTQKLYDLVNYKFELKWLRNLLNLIGLKADIPDTISLLGILGILSVGTLIIIIIYNIFK